MGTGRKKTRVLPWLLLVFVFVFALCIRTGTEELISPVQAFKNLWLWLRLTVADRFSLPLALERQALIEGSPYFLETVARFRILVMTALCGAAIAAGGAVFQLIFRNPMAAPSMLGVTSGIDLGLLVLVLRYGSGAFLMTGQRYLYCMCFAFALLLLVILLGRLAGKNRVSVTDMLLIGGILSQIIGAVITFARYGMEQEELEVFQTLSLYGFTANVSYEFAGRSLWILLALVLVCMLPLVSMRFSLDALSLSDREARSLGVRPYAVRLVLIVTTTVMVVGACLYCGTIGVLALAVPHIVRAVRGADFKSLLTGSILWGALLLLISRAISSLVYLEGMGHFPIGTMTGLLTAPLLAVILVQNRRSWE